MKQMACILKNLTKTVSPPLRTILKNISISFFPGAKVGLLGINGAGKSTLLRIMAGLDTAFSGEVIRDNSLTVGYLPQEPQFDPEQSVRQAIEEAVSEITAALSRLETLYAEYSVQGANFEALAAEQMKLEAFIQAKEGHRLETHLEQMATALDLPDQKLKMGQLSGGEKRRVALCQLLLKRPDMLLLDEPTNHLDATAVRWLETFLKEYSGTVVAVTHDRYFLDNVAGWILELDRGVGFPFEGNYSAWLVQKQQRLLHEEVSEKARQRTIAQELEWIAQQPKARQAKNKARLARFEELSRLEYQKRNETNEIFIPPGPRLGEQVISVAGLTKYYGERLLFENLSFNVPRGAIVGIIGPNGSGKSTLYKLIAGLEPPSAGEIRIGETVQLATVDQFRDQLCNQHTVWEEISGGLDRLKIGAFELPSRAYVSRFNFKGSDQQKRVGSLSGGERGRLHLAKLLQSGANVLLLDEPTNDLDVETLRALEVALLEFAGSILVISHDRWFLDRISTHILDYSVGKTPTFFEGNFTDYQNWRLKQA